MEIIGGNRFLKGEIKIPGDKSISHRSIILSSIAEGETEIYNFLDSEDTKATIDCFRKMGISIDKDGEKLVVKGKGLKGLAPPDCILDCKNSGTTMRLISGVLVGQNFSTILTGDNSLNNRPMSRIINPLKRMGGNIEGLDNEYPPLKIRPISNLNEIYYKMPVASAQVKSAILLASLYAEGETIIEEKGPSRDHTERMLNYFGARINKNNNLISLKGGSRLEGRKIFIPGDFSSASFFIVAALILEGSEIVIKDVGLNETRVGLLHVLKEMGGNIEIDNVKKFNNELVGDIYVKYSKLKSTNIYGNKIATFIDEIPILVVAATFAEGTTTINDASELKYKESDRIKVMTEEMNKMGASIKALEDGMIIEGGSSLKPAKLNSYNDHRIAMALSIAALKAEGKSYILGSECINISFPTFSDIPIRKID